MSTTVAENSYKLAKKAIFLSKELKQQHEYELAKQILKSGTSIGANITEASGAESKRDFVHKMKIALKEANETRYWLDLLFDTEHISQNKYQEISELLLYTTNQLAKIIITTQKRYLNP